MTAKIVTIVDWTWEQVKSVFQNPGPKLTTTLFELFIYLIIQQKVPHIIFRYFRYHTIIIHNTEVQRLNHRFKSRVTSFTYIHISIHISESVWLYLPHLANISQSIFYLMAMSYHKIASNSKYFNILLNQFST